MPEAGPAADAPFHTEVMRHQPTEARLQPSFRLPGTVHVRADDLRIEATVEVPGAVSVVHLPTGTCWLLFPSADRPLHRQLVDTLIDMNRALASIR